MKVVFDTNVYVAESLGGDTATRLFTSTVRASWRIYVSRYIVDEMTAVMTDDLGLSRRSAALAAIRALRRGILIEPAASRHTVPQDPADCEVLRTALQAGADYFVTNDRHLLALHPYHGVHIISMADYRKILEERELFV
jgi:putative PIN family toxin of toxin-antitoxin system